jgi:uncharacterized protein YndB with AHSA1/START domain
MNMKTEQASIDEPIVVMSRTFDAPRDLVWRVFTDPKHVAIWYGGHGFSSPTCEMDVRPGGSWRHVMRTPDGTEYSFEFVFIEVVAPEKIVWENADHAKRREGFPPTCRNTVTFEESDERRKTKWKLVARFHTLADRDAALRSGFTTMVTQGSEKLNAIVKALAEGKPS